MAEIITKGYLINRCDYGMFDEVISFINEHGNIFTVLSLGVKKILSKNGRNLFYGCLSEFWIFASRDIDNKMGKLKKVNILENNISISTRTPLILFSKIIYDSKLKGEKTFKFFEELVDFVKNYNETNDYLIMTHMLHKIMDILGIKPILDKCCFCENKNIYSFSFINNGFVCKQHFNLEQDLKYESETIKLIYMSKDKNIFKINNFNILTQKIVIKIFLYYMDLNSGINLWNLIDF